MDIASVSEKFCVILMKNTGSDTGHIHFIYKGKRDSLVLLCHNGLFHKIVAKNDSCKQNECLRWEKSDFATLSPEDAFQKNLANIERVVLDMLGLEKEYQSLDAFLEWLEAEGRGG